MTDVITDLQTKVAEAFASIEDKIDTLAGAGHEWDVETKQGNAECRSYCYTLRGLNGAIDRTRKEQKAHYLEAGRVVDRHAKGVEAKVTAALAPHTERLRVVEEREAARIQRIRGRIDALALFGVAVDATTGKFWSSSDKKDHLVALDKLDLSEDGGWDEFLDEALQAHADAVEAAARAHEDAQSCEAEARELERLRAEKADSDRLALEKAEQERRDRIETERKAREEALAKAAAENALKEAQEAAQRREREFAEKAAQEMREAEQRHQRELKAAAEAAMRAEQELLDEAKRKEQEAAAVERARLDALRAEDDAKVARERNNAHRVEVMGVVVDELVKHGIEKEAAETVATLIAAGLVPHVRMEF